MSNDAEKSKHAALDPFTDSRPGSNPRDGQDLRNFEEYSRVFGKHLSDNDGRTGFSEEDRIRKDRAKRANQIYRQVCENVGVKSCFFSNFSEWSDYMDGRMSESEFEEHAVLRARGMKAEEN
ncbi:MAG: hypothetical protein LLG06_04810 [Desulfobacteraceae bacterium]|nr:hypothetical protein [Desulfobacteraceae bacterium]